MNVRIIAEVGENHLGDLDRALELVRLAARAGADFVKLFPAPANVAEYIRFILAPLPYLKIFPTSGVNLDNMLDVLQAGAAGIGFVRPLFDPEMIRNKNYGGIRQRAEAIVERLASL